MKYRIFDTEAEAIAAETQIAHDIGCIKVGVNAKTGDPAPDKQSTERWAIPQETLQGKWVFPSPDDTGVDFDPAWFPEETE